MSEYADELELEITLTTGKARVIVQYDDLKVGLQALYKVAKPEYLAKVLDALTSDYDEWDGEEEDDS